MFLNVTFNFLYERCVYRTTGESEHLRESHVRKVKERHVKLPRIGKCHKIKNAANVFLPVFLPDPTGFR